MRQYDVEGVGLVEFPDEVSDEQAMQYLSRKYGKKQPEPGGLLPELGKSFARGVVGAVAAIPETAGAVADATRRLVGIEIPDGEQSDLTTLGESIRGLVPPRTRPGLVQDVAEGVGQVASIVTGGLAAGAVRKGMAMAAATTMATTAEFSDAYSRELERQQSAGEPENPDLALGKAASYALVAGAIESKLGAGRVLNRIEKAFRGELKLNGVGNFVFNRLRDAGAGFTEEAAQRAIQDLIVDGSLSPDEIVREGGVGAIIQSLFGIPVDIISGPTAALEATGSTATAEAIRQAEADLPTNEEGETLEAQGAQEVLNEVGPVAETAGPTVPETDFGEMPEPAENTGVPGPAARPSQAEPQPAFQAEPEAAQPPPNPVESFPKPAAGPAVETRSVRGKGYTIPSETEAARDDYFDQQIDQFGNDYLTALREAKNADIPGSYKGVVVGKILSRATAELAQHGFESPRYQELVRAVRDADGFIGQSRAAAAQDLQASKQINEDLAPYSAVLSYFKLIESRFDRVVPAALRTEDAAAKINQIIKDCG